MPARPPVEATVTIYHAQPHGNRDPLGELVRPGIFVDVASVLDQKAAMLACHASQKQWLDESQGLDSYIDTMKDLMRQVGRFQAASNTPKAGGSICTWASAGRTPTL